jgi:hypothetical protein
MQILILGKTVPKEENSYVMAMLNTMLQSAGIRLVLMKVMTIQHGLCHTTETCEDTACSSHS